MKILIINGGFRKRNTWQLVEVAKQHLKSNDSHITFETIQIKDLEIPFCVGCSLCFRNGHSECPHNDTMQPLIDKILESDGVIFAAPTFNLDMPALTKNVLDHLCFALHRPIFVGKKALIISTTGGIGAKQSTKKLEGTLLGMGFIKCYKIAITAYSWNDYQPSSKEIDQTINTTSLFYNDIFNSIIHTPKIPQILMFNLFKGMCANPQIPNQYKTLDHTYWSNKVFENKVYFPEMPVPLHKHIIGQFFYLIGRRFSKKTIITFKQY